MSENTNIELYSDASTSQPTAPQPSDLLFHRIEALIEESRQRVKTVVNTAMVYTYFEVGRYIVEEQQQGRQRAAYGKALLKELSERLTDRFGEGWSYANLKNIRQFFLCYSKRLTSGYPIDATKANQWLADSEMFQLSWSHYLILMRVEDENARSFYEIECVRQQWSKRQLMRQVGSCLYERLALRRDKKERTPTSTHLPISYTYPTRLCCRQKSSSALKSSRRMRMQGGLLKRINYGH